MSSRLASSLVMVDELNPRIKEALVRLKSVTTSTNNPVTHDGHTKKSDVEFVYTSSPKWPLPSSFSLSRVPQGQQRQPIPIRVIILDSSFNPPTRAHLALASVELSTLIPADPAVNAGHNQGLPHEVQLLLLSVTNADKRLKVGDATYEPRLEMMCLVANEMEEGTEGTEGESGRSESGNRRAAEAEIKSSLLSSSSRNVAVAAIDEPTFVGKSKKLKEEISKRIQEIGLGGVETGDADMPPFALSLYFVLGFDTVTRLFDTKFYNGSHDEMSDALGRFFNEDDSYVICARRTLSTTTQGGVSLRENRQRGQDGPRDDGVEKEKEEEERFLSSEMVSPLVRQGKILLFDFEDPLLKRVSSTKARDSVRSSYSDPVQERREIDSGSISEIEANLTHRIATYVASRRLYLPNNADGIL
ncbi:hypothetical protein FRC17_002656 [Serendipita sp. 399]|nr:hypothetical protein FRC17_002656 [Serendipita sp. 399]